MSALSRLQVLASCWGSLYLLPSDGKMTSSVKSSLVACIPGEQFSYLLKRQATALAPWYQRLHILWHSRLSRNIVGIRVSNIIQYSPIYVKTNVCELGMFA